MTGFEELRALGVTFGPFDGPVPPASHESSRFASRWGDTVALLARELRMLDAEGIVVELNFRPEYFRLDGLPRANASADSPAVRVTFRSRWGPLRYETAEYRSWQDNVRAIALSMEALRKVDRYGVSKRGEQYRGWRQLTAGSTAAEDSVVTSGQAVAVVHREVEDLYDLEDVAGAFQADAIREALRRSHPDRGGSGEKFRMIMRAREILEDRA